MQPYSRHAVMVEEPRNDIPDQHTVGVMRLAPSQRAAPNKKSRTRQQSILFRVTSYTWTTGGMNEGRYEEPLLYLNLLGLLSREGYRLGKILLHLSANPAGLQ